MDRSGRQKQAENRALLQIRAGDPSLEVGVANAAEIAAGPVLSELFCPPRKARGE